MPEGYFAGLRSDDSDIGEVGEAVVNVNHRRRGLMTRMLEALIERAEEEGLLGVVGEAVTAHEISQRANARFDFVSSALNLAYQPTERFAGLIADYQQPISNLIDFKPLVPYDTVTPHLPDTYADVLQAVYDELGAIVLKPDAGRGPLPEEATLDARIDYGTVTVHFRRDFNLLTVRHLRQVAQGTEHVRIDLSRARIVDTEAIATLWALQDDGVRVTVHDPPALFHDVINALDLEEVFEVNVAEPT